MEDYSGEELEGRDPVWCHDCGTYTFLDEWGDSSVGVADVCPKCGSVFPAVVGGPILDEEDRVVAAIAWRVAR